MNDLISRQAAIDVLAAMQGMCTSKAALIQNSKVWQQIKDLPSVDRPTGEWNPYYTKREHNHVFNCKLCGYTFIVLQGNDNMNFCPNCGVDMRKRQTVR